MAHLARAVKQSSFKGIVGTTLSAALFALTIGAPPAAARCPGPGCPAGMDIVDTANAAKNLTTLASGLSVAGLADTLREEGPFTVFAPTDEAFASLPAGTVEDLLKPENRDKLVAILAYQVVPGRISIDDLSEGMNLTTIQGSILTITLDGGPRVNGARIIGRGIETTNGIVFPIDSVILPPEG